LESSKVIDLEKFLPRDEVDPVYFNNPYYLYPDGEMAVEAIRVIAAAMADAGIVGIGRLTISRRQRMVVVDPRGSGMVLITLRAAEEVRAPQCGKADGTLDCAGDHRTADREIRSQQVPRPLPGVTAGADRSQDERAADQAARDFDPCTHNRSDLMAALKRSLVQEPPAGKGAKTTKRANAAPDRRQRAMLLPVAGGRKKNEEAAAEPATVATRGRKEA